MSSLAAQAAKSDGKPCILIIHSYSPDYSWTRDMESGILSVLRSPETHASYRVEYMDSKRYTSPDHLSQLLVLYRKKYAGSRFDGVILTDNHALELIARHKDELFPDTPITVCGINDPASIPDGVSDMNIILESSAHRETLEWALRQNPDTKKIFVVVDGTLTGQSILRDFKEQTRSFDRQVEIEVLPPQTFDSLLRFARTCTQGQLIYLLVYFEDSAGRTFEAEEIPRVVAAAAPVPVYVGWDFQTGQGTVGGCVTSAFGHGRKAAETLLERLRGEHPPALYSGVQDVSRQIYDFSALQRFGIPLSAVPSDALILNRPKSYFETHRSAILGALAIIGVLILIIILLIQNVVRQKWINRSNEKILSLNREVIETQMEVLSTLGEVIETRSHETANHVRRVAAYSVLLGRKCGLDEEALLLLEAAAPMHDVGKIGIPESILHKPGPLSPEEFEIIKHHTVIGYEILNKSNRALMATATDIALQHHERWDGTGYPCGLKGEQICLQARISSLADVYDALSHDRIYKKAWSQEKVFDFIRQERGRMFDPTIVDLFFENIDELERIRVSLSDPVSRDGSAEAWRPLFCPLSKSQPL